MDQERQTESYQQHFAGCLEKVKDQPRVVRCNVPIKPREKLEDVPHAVQVYVKAILRAMAEVRHYEMMKAYPELRGQISVSEMVEGMLGLVDDGTIRIEYTSTDRSYRLLLWAGDGYVQG